MIEGCVINNEIYEVEPFVSELDKLSKSTKIEVATNVFGKIKTLKRESSDLLEYICDLIEKDEL